MGKSEVYTVEYLSKISVDKGKKILKEQFLLNCSDTTIEKVNENANCVHLAFMVDTEVLHHRTIKH